MPRLPPHTFYIDLPVSGTLPGCPLQAYVADTGRPHCLYHNGIQNGALPAFPLVLGTTKSHRGTRQGCMGDDLRHRAQILRYSCTKADLWAGALSWSNLMPWTPVRDLRF